MKTIYFIIADTTKKREDPLQMYFYTRNALNDLCGLLTSVAEDHGTPVSKMRLYIAPDKKTWDRMYNEFCARADWSQYDPARAVHA